MKRLILLAVVLAVCTSLAGWRGRFDEQFAAASSRWTPAELNPIAWYKGDGNALDAMGNYDGTWVGTEAYADGPTGQAFDFHRSNSVNAQYSPNLSGWDDFSINFWVNCESTLYARNEYLMGVYSTGASGRSWGVIKRSNVHTLSFIYSKTGSDFTYLNFSADISKGVYLHVSINRVGDQVLLYVDGVLFESIACVGTLHTSRAGLTISGRDKHVEMFKGQIDDVLIFDRALTAEEIEKLYNESIKRNGAAW